LGIWKHALKTMFVLFIGLLALASAVNYQVTKKIPIPGQGGWDYLTIDEAAPRLYVSHETQVEVLDVDSGTIVGRILKTPGAQGIAIAAELCRGFVSNGLAATVIIFDLKTAEAHRSRPYGQEPGRNYFRSRCFTCIRLPWRQQ
jgi:hypothetical protein